MSKSYRVHIHNHGDQGRWLAQQDFTKRPTREMIDAAFPVLAEPGRYEVRVNIVSGDDELHGWGWLQGSYVKDPANPTDAELAAAIDRGLADGSLITAEDFMARFTEDDAASANADAGLDDHGDRVAECDHDYSIMLAIPRKIAGAITGYDDYRECRHCGRRAPASAVTEESMGKAQRHLEDAAGQIADEITRAARGSGDDPVAWVTGNAFMPPLRSFTAAEQVWQADEDGGAFAILAELVEAKMAEREIALECPEYDNALYAVDLRRFEYVDDPGDHETLQQDWQPRQPAHLAQGHEPGRLYGCPACEDRCHCNPGEMECVYDGEHNGLGIAPEPDVPPAPVSGRCATGAHALKRG